MPEYMIPIVFDVEAPDRETAARLMDAALASDGGGMSHQRGLLEVLREKVADVADSLGVEALMESWWFPEADLKHIDHNDRWAMSLVKDDAALAARGHCMATRSGVHVAGEPGEPCEACGEIRPDDDEADLKHKVWVVSFEPDPEAGGVGGFDWGPAATEAHALFEKSVAEADPGLTIALWVHETDLDPATQRDEITEEIDDLWAEGWPPNGAEVIARHTAAQ